jgi:Tfp pilus assembly PilM family ATPase
MVISATEKKVGRKNKEYMSQTIQSFCFQEKQISYIQAKIDDHNITIEKAKESLLPLEITLDNINLPDTVDKISHHLNSLTGSEDSLPKNVRFLLTGKFMLIKKVLVDNAVPEAKYGEFVKGEMNQVLTNSIDEYLMYLPEYSVTRNGYKEILVVVFKQEILNFFKRIAEAAHLRLSQISVNCFSIDDLYRKLYADQTGQSLLVNFSERGFELIISNEKNFLNFSFKPYSSKLEPITQLVEEDVLNSLISALKDIQSPILVDKPIYSISTIFLFGNYFKPEWLESLQSKLDVPVQILNPTESNEWRINYAETSFDQSEAYRYVEPISNLFE